MLKHYKYVICSPGRESLTVLWRVVAQQSWLSLAFVGVGSDILWESGKKKEEREVEK